MKKIIDLEQDVIELIERKAKECKRSTKAQIEHMVNMAALRIPLKVDK